MVLSQKTNMGIQDSGNVPHTLRGIPTAAHYTHYTGCNSQI